MNQEIPASEFVVALPAGTGVLDSHLGDINRFVLVPDSPHLKELSDIIVCAEPAATWSIWQWKYAVALALAAALVATFFFKRRKSPSQKPATT